MNNNTSKKQMTELPNEELPLQILAISHNIIRMPSGSTIPYPITGDIECKETNGRFYQCKVCKTQNPKLRTFCYECNNLLI